MSFEKLDDTPNSGAVSRRGFIAAASYMGAALESHLAKYRKLVPALALIGLFNCFGIHRPNEWRAPVG